MRKNNSITRIQKIYDILQRGGYWGTSEITEILGEPKGTISPFISALELTGNITRHNHKYKLPYPLKSAEQVAKEIREYYKKIRSQKLKNIVDAVASEKPSQLTIDIDKNFKDLGAIAKKQDWSFNRVESYHIEQAIQLLKSKGYKVLEPVTEFREI